MGAVKQALIVAAETEAAETGADFWEVLDRMQTGR